MWSFYLLLLTFVFVVSVNLQRDSCSNSAVKQVSCEISTPKLMWNSCGMSTQTPVWEMALKHLLKHCCEMAVEHPNFHPNSSVGSGFETSTQTLLWNGCGTSEHLPKLQCGKWFWNIYSKTIVEQLWNIHPNFCVGNGFQMSTQTLLWNSCEISTKTGAIKL